MQAQSTARLSKRGRIVIPRRAASALLATAVAVVVLAGVDPGFRPAVLPTPVGAVVAIAGVGTDGPADTARTTGRTEGRTRVDGLEPGGRGRGASS